MYLLANNRARKLLGAIIPAACMVVSLGAESALAQANSPATAKEFAESLSANWDVSVLRKWADPLFMSSIVKDSGALQNNLKIAGKRFGKLKKIRAVTAGPKDAKRALYQVDVDYANGPAKINIALVPVGNQWRVQQLGVDSKLLAAAGPSQGTIKKMQDYVDTQIPKLGRTWDFEQFKAQADPRMFQGKEPEVKKMFDLLTGQVGPVVSYKKSELVGSGSKNGEAMGSFRAYFVGKTAEGMAAVTVALHGNQCRITDFNIGKKVVQAKPQVPAFKGKP